MAMTTQELVNLNDYTVSVFGASFKDSSAFIKVLGDLIPKQIAATNAAVRDELLIEGYASQMASVLTNYDNALTDFVEYRNTYEIL